jgi:hypothetical protein
MVVENIASHAARLDTSTPRRLGLFDLPRELRDQIYFHAIVDLQQRHEVYKYHRCSCSRRVIDVSPPRPPYFNGEFACPTPAKWLGSVSLVSKQFATEIRPFFWRGFLFSLDQSFPKDWHIYLTSRTLPKFDTEPLEATLPVFTKFIHSLDKEARLLRRVALEVPFLYLPTPIPDVEKAVAPIADQLHTDLMIFFQIRDEREPMDSYDWRVEDNNVIVRKLGRGTDFRRWYDWISDPTNANRVRKKL